MPELETPPDPFTFVVGKGGVGKTTTAAALALHWAARRRVHLISTDPAHSLGDVFARELTRDSTTGVCTPELTVEQLDAEARTQQWLAHVREPFTQLLERGSYLDREDIARFTALRLPGTDELMAALRLVELAESAPTVVVDTAPTGHTLRLLDAHLLLDSWTALLRALAAKGDAVARALVGAVASGASPLIAELEQQLRGYRERVLQRAGFVVVTRAGEPVRAETERLIAALHARGLRLRHTVDIDASSPGPRGCAELAAWPAAPQRATTNPAAPRADGSGEAWLRARTQQLLLFPGKGGVGKSTCAAAAAVVLAETRRVLLLSADPAGSLADVLQQPVGALPAEVGANLRAAQIDAEATLRQWREDALGLAEPLLEQLGVGGDAALDRRVFAALWDLAPPGMDELVALSELLDAVGQEETVVLDTSPTGHFLRLLAMPEVALEWAHAFMRILLKYGVAGELDALTRRVLAFARQLKDIRSKLADAGWTGCVVVTLDEPVVEAETKRLVTSLAQAGVPLAAILTNRHAASSVAPVARPVVSMTSPLSAMPILGIDALRRFAAAWEIL